MTSEVLKFTNNEKDEETKIEEFIIIIIPKINEMKIRKTTNTIS